MIPVGDAPLHETDLYSGIAIVQKPEIFHRSRGSCARRRRHGTSREWPCSEAPATRSVLPETIRRSQSSMAVRESKSPRRARPSPPHPLSQLTRMNRCRRVYPSISLASLSRRSARDGHQRTYIENCPSPRQNVKTPNDVEINLAHARNFSGLFPVQDGTCALCKFG